jgi:hypothetical protein
MEAYECLNYGGSWRRSCGFNQKPRTAAAALPDQWPEVRRAILYALADFPDARAAVAAAIRKFASEDRNESVG